MKEVKKESGLYSKDDLVEPEDVVCDAICKSVDILPFANDFEVNPDKFFGEINSRSKKVKIELVFKIINAKNRHEFEEMVHELYLLGV